MKAQDGSAEEKTIHPTLSFWSFSLWSSQTPLVSSILAGTSDLCHTKVRIFEFKNLLYISLKTSCLPFDFDEDHAQPLAALVHACPDIRILELDFDDIHDSGGEWSVGAMWAPLEDMTFSSLRTFRATGKVNPDWYQFFDSPKENPLRRFFMRHPRLETIGLGWFEESEYQNPIDPEDMDSLFPGLIHAELPAFLWVPVAASKLVEQIVSVTLTDEFLYDYTNVSFKDIAKSARSMPKARRFKFNPRRFEGDDIDGLEDVLRLMPALETLEMGLKFEPDEIVSLLSSTPNLRKAVIHIPHTVDESERSDYISSMAKMCPRLVSVDNAEDEDDVIHWGIIRTPAGDIKVAVEED
ncbi:F-box-like protein [Ceratobasidium sp. AG-Ba]|nr:F-box-like protein [Ceratobasidium sp. AG-Ba]QRW06261.1 F-box-like protein [Ceratobasidium sp. AG-Ba]